MEKIMDWITDPKNRIYLVAAAGLLIGWFIFGWALFPAPVRNATPAQLKDSFKSEYLCNTIHSYLRTGDQAKAVAQIKALGSSGEADLSTITPGTCYLNADELTQFRVMLATAGASPSNETAGQSPETAVQDTPDAAATPAAGNDEKSGGLLLPILLCLSTLLLGAALVYFFVFKGKAGKDLPNIDLKAAGNSVSAWAKNGVEKASSAVNQLRKNSAHEMEPTAEGGVSASPVRSDESGPIAQFLTSYKSGDDQFGDAFSIDNGNGEFFGECGMDISDQSSMDGIGHVNAFEVWLFDRNDIQTVTKVLMTPFAFSDPIIRARLESKGEMLQAQAEQVVELETATLRLEAKVRELQLHGDSLPDETYFEKFTVELWVYEK